jgi:hypothetical protein
MSVKNAAAHWAGVLRNASARGARCVVAELGWSVGRVKDWKG